MGHQTERSLGGSRRKFDRAIATHPSVFERAPDPGECWLLRARAFAETDPERALAAYRRAISLRPGLARAVDADRRLADLLEGDANG